jgi:hypothetical protein
MSKHVYARTLRRVTYVFDYKRTYIGMRRTRRRILCLRYFKLESAQSNVVQVDADIDMLRVILATRALRFPTYRLL